MASLQDDKDGYADRPDLSAAGDRPRRSPAEGAPPDAPQSALNRHGDDADRLPKLGAPADGELTADVVPLLRRFHLDDPRAAAQTETIPETLLPALLHPYRDVSSIRHQYPLYLYPPQNADDQPLAEPLGRFLRTSVETFATGEEAARILKDNLPWIERYLRQGLDGGTPADAGSRLARAGEALQDHLDLNASNRDRLQTDLEKLTAVLGEGGQFLGYGPDVAIHLLVHAIDSRCSRRRPAFRHAVDELIDRLRTLLQVERSKTVPADDPDVVENSVGPGARYIDATALSGMLGQRSHGSVVMPAERRKRIEEVLAVLSDYKEASVLVRFVGALDDPRFADSPMIDVIESSDPCAMAAEIYEHEATYFSRVFAAARIAELEIEDRYDPTVHDSWFAGFDWQAFSQAETQLVTTVVALESADRVAGDGLPSFSRLLGSRKPVHILTWVRACDNPGAMPDEQPFQSFRFELGYFGIGHRQVVVAQTTAAHHEDLLSGFLAALDGTRTSLHLINRGTRTQTKSPVLDPWIMTSTALESRAHPFILVDPDAGDHAAQRVRFNGNPQAERDWPLETLHYQDDRGKITEMDLAFTFADYALLIPRLQRYFRMVPDGCQSDDLVPADDYLDLSADRVDRCVPFIWAIDADGALHRLVVARVLMLACGDRRNYWRALQELAGIHNLYVDRAIERARSEEQRAHEAEQARLQQTFAEELERVRCETAGEVMGQLADVLLGGGLADLAGSGKRPANVPRADTTAKTEPAIETKPEPPAAEPEVPMEDEVSFDNPWIDSAMCTTCDDCMSVNKVLFVYNENKQAVIEDPEAGSYADLVKAAEICPAKCIHPGKPLDPDEPGLDELIARAEPYI